MNAFFESWCVGTKYAKWKACSRFRPVNELSPQKWLNRGHHLFKSCKFYTQKYVGYKFLVEPKYTVQSVLGLASLPITKLNCTSNPYKYAFKVQ